MAKNRLLIFLTILFLLSGCQVYNSFSQDATKFSSGPNAGSGAEGQRFTAAYTVFQNRCVSCHNNFGTYVNESDWINAGLVVSDQPTQSLVYIRLTGSGLGTAQTPENMPLSGGALSATDLQTIYNWIVGIGQP